MYQLLERPPLGLEASRAANCEAFAGRGKPRERKNTACWLYGELYHARNDFLHGNPVEMERLTIEKSGRDLFGFAAPLYRLALAAFLPLVWSRPSPPIDNVEELGQYMTARMDFMDYQTTIEESLLKAHELPNR